VGKTVANNKNNGLFDKIKKTIDQGSSGTPTSSSFFDTSSHDIGHESEELIDIPVSRPLKRLKRKSPTTEELALKYKEESIKKIKSQKQKFKKELKEEVAINHKTLKAQYERIAKTLLKQREQELSRKYSEQLHAKISQLQHKLSAHYQQQFQTTQDKLNLKIIKLQQELEQKQQEMINNVATAKIAARQEQEEYNKSVYEDLELCKQNYESRIKELQDNSRKEIDKQSELFAAEKQALNATIEKMLPEVEANKLAIRSEVEAMVRAEFDLKYHQYKIDLDKAKTLEVEALLTAEKQIISEALQAENAIVLKYKEREIRDSFDFDAMLAKQEILLKQALEQQEHTLNSSHQLQLEQLAQRIAAENEEKLQYALVQERAKVAEQNTHEKKLLLQQQQSAMQMQFDAEKQTLLQQQGSIQMQFDAEKKALLQQQGNMQMQFESEKIVLLKQQQDVLRAQLEADRDALLEQQKCNLQKQFEYEKQMLLKGFADQKNQLLNEMDLKLLQQKHQLTIELKNDNANVANNATLQQQEAVLRAQFDAQISKERAIWNQERLSLQNEQDIAAIEDELQLQFDAKLQQQEKKMALEIQRIKQKLKDKFKDDQQGQIQAAVESSTATLRDQYEKELKIIEQEQEAKFTALLDQERKKVNLKFAQDKSTLIKDLTERFSREKQIASQQYETELRDKLYKEMVKQKDYIQQKFSSMQESALNEQKRRLEAEHKHEIERIKQGYFDPVASRTQHDHIVAERGVEQLADRILAKFQFNDTRRKT
jgi:hypothetical protein